ncbi:neuronal acetylcholine receptor subunit beta-3-like [Mya arenaria]|uniref:neuronal acetylcholine receptor subunit beta-3-like n=1 Tax=Mya arenaria TaxID=6604 RepID=UPI0022E820C2|nr:neuronal acetylcholine receptor subunit beta-3-like [Mya arenaria]
MKTFTPFCVLLTVIVLECLLPNAHGKNYTDAMNLRSTLLQNYHKDIVPLANQSSTMKVNVTLYLYSLLEIDSVKGSVTMPLMTMCTWMDEQLTWTPSDHGGIEEIAFYQSEVWKPPLSLGTPIEFVIMQNDMMHVIVMHNGMAMMSPGNIIESACTFNMKFWPFDKQVCDVSFWAYDVIDNQVELNIPDDGFVSLVTKNAEWILESTRFFKRQSGMMKEVVFRLYLKRQSGFYVLTILLPIIGLSILGTMAFLLPVDSGERIGFSITVMLSLSVFLTVIAEEMPKTSEPISIAAVLIVFQTVCGLAETMIAILTVLVYQKDEKEKLPSWGKAFIRARKYIYKCFNNKVEDESHSDNVEAMKESTSGNLKRNQLLDSNKGITEERKADRANDIDNGKDEDGNETSEWVLLSDAIDKVSFMFFFGICVLVTLVLMVYMIAGSEYVEY